MRVFQPDRYLLSKFVEKNATLLTGHLLDVGGQDGKRYRGNFAHVEKYTVLDPEQEYEPDIVAGAEDIPLEDASIDSILCTEVLMDVFELQKAISEMSRVLKPGGVLLATVSFMGPLCDEPYHYWRFTPYSLQKLLEPYFENIRIENRGGYRLQKAQNQIRYRINRLDLYKRPLLGRVFSALSFIRFKIALRGDWNDRSAANRGYAIGYNVIAKRKG